MTASDEANERTVEVRWTDNSAVEAGYVVTRRADGQAGPGAEVARLGRNEATFLDRTGDPGATYTYAVAAVQTTAGVEGRSAVAEDAGRRVLLAPAAVAAGVIVVQSTRAGSGVVPATTRLRERGILSADNLTPQKARILLALALTVSRDPADVAEMFATY